MRTEILGAPSLFFLSLPFRSNARSVLSDLYWQYLGKTGIFPHRPFAEPKVMQCRSQVNVNR